MAELEIHQDPPNTGEVDLRAIVALLRRRLWVIVATIIVALVVGALVTIRAPRIYEAKARILIEKAPPQVLSDDVREVYNLGSHTFWASQEYYNTQYKVIQGAAVADKVVSMLGMNPKALAERIKGLGDESLEAKVSADPLSELPAPLQEKVKFLGLGNVRSRATLVEKLEKFNAAGFVRKKISVEPLKETQLVDIVISDTDPKRAAILANTLVKAYSEFNLDNKARVTGNAVEWLSDKELELKDTLQQSELALYQFKEDNNIVSVSLEDRQSMISQKLNALSATLSAVTAERLAIESTLEEIRRARKEGRPLDALSEVADNGLVQQLKQNRATIKQEVVEFSLRYTPEHPKMTAAREKLALVEAELANEIDKTLASTRGQYERLLDNERRIKREIEATKAEALAINKREIDYRRLKRESDKNRDLYNQLLKRQKETDLTRGLRVNNVFPQEPATTPGSPVSPRVSVNMLIALLLGLLLGVGLAFLVDFLDNSVKTQEQVEKLLRLSLLGILPTIKTKKTRRESAVARPEERDLFIMEHPRSSVAECCRTVRTNLMFMSPDDPARTLLITSSGPREGKSTVAVNLAITMAQSGKRVAIVDTDMRRPRLHKSFGVDNAMGVSNLIMGEGSLSQAVKPTAVENLDLLTCGPIPPNPSELIHTESFQALKNDLERTYDRVIFDSPPVSAVTDAMILSSMIDGVVLVIHAGRTSWQSALQAKRKLADVGAKIYGVVLNDVDLDDKKTGGYYYQYYYYYRSGYTDEGEREQKASA